MIAKDVFKVGNHGIGWVDSDFKSRYGDEEVTETEVVPEFKKLGRTMTNSEIDKEFAPTKSSLGHVLAFLKNPPEGTKDGYSNIFYVGAFVVSVRWYSDDVGWFVFTWPRGGFRWDDEFRVFSPAFGSVVLSTMPSDTLTLRAQIGKVEEELAKLKKLVG